MSSDPINSQNLSEHDKKEISKFKKFLKKEMNPLEQLRYDGFTEEEIKFLQENCTHNFRKMELIFKNRICDKCAKEEDEILKQKEVKKINISKRELEYITNGFDVEIAQILDQIYIVHGRPGSGKSTISFRLGKVLSRISADFHSKNIKIQHDFEFKEKNTVYIVDDTLSKNLQGHTFWQPDWRKINEDELKANESYLIVVLTDYTKINIVSEFMRGSSN